MNFFDLNIFDLILVAVLSVFAITGMLRGLVLELLSLIMWPIAAIAAWLFADNVEGWFKELIGDSQLRLVACFIMIFVAVFIVGSILGYFINKVLPLKGVLRAPNLILGGAVGIVRGAVIIVIVFLVAGITTIPQRPWWRESALAPTFQTLAMEVSAYLPRDVARHIRYG